MNDLDSNISSNCKYEIMAKISFHYKTTKNQAVNVLCSRLLAQHFTREKSKYDILNYESLEKNDTFDKDHIKDHDNNFSDKSSSNRGEIFPTDLSSKQDLNCSQEIESNKEDECSSVQEKFRNLNTNEFQQHAQWYTYWEKNGEDIVRKTWIEQYGNCTVEDLPIDIDEMYKNHREEQYHVLYWKFINESYSTDVEVDENFENDQNSSDGSEELDIVKHISNFDFLHKYKHFHQVNSKLIKAYAAISIMGHIYNDQNIFGSAIVQYLKTNLIKSTRHLNIYKFPKKCESIDTDNQLLSNSDDNLKNNKKNIKNRNKKSKKREKLKQNRDNQMTDELQKFGYSYLQNNSKLLKYWKKRYLLFSEFEKGIQLDEESWYSVTPEIISSHIADRCSCYLIIDPFCGAGGNIIQFAKTCELVIAIDNDPKKIEIARHNAELYGVADRIQFIIGDYFALAPTLKADVVFLSPPWGGPDLMNLDEYKLSYIMPENGGGEHILHLARQITSNIAFHLPKNTNFFDCIKSADDSYIEVQQNVLNSRYNSQTVYYSELYGLCDEYVDVK